MPKGSQKVTQEFPGTLLGSNALDFQFSNCQALALAIATVPTKSLVPTIHKPDHSKSGRFCLNFKWFLTNGSHLPGFQMVGLPDFRSHSKSGPLATQHLFVWISDPHCILLPHS